MSKRLLGAICSCALLLTAPSHAKGQVLPEGTRLSNLKMGSAFETTTRQTARGGYELEGGRFKSLGDWYSSDWRDLSVILETPLNDNSWLTWGFSTGERGDKYRVQPSLIVGFQKVWTIRDSSFLTFDITARIGGHLQEDPCSANYSLSNEQVAVNCRLAASLLPPDQTLDYLWDVAPPDRLRVSLGFVTYF